MIMSDKKIKNEIDWIGSIPHGWASNKAKYLFALRSSKGNSLSLKLLTPSQIYGVIPQEKYERLSSFKTVKLKEGTDLKQFRTVHKGDFCISLRSFQGGFEFSTYEGVVSPAYKIFYPVKKVCGRYYKYLFKVEPFINKINSLTLSLRDGKNISFFDFGNIRIPKPNLEVQEKIANFLDNKCSEIDSLVADIQKEISILEEYKKTVITEAVTKGITHCVEMKNSPCPWIGAVPSHWVISKLKYKLRRNDVKNRGNCTVLSLYREYGVIPKDSRDDNHNVTSEDTSKYKFVRVGDFVINKMKAWQGSVAVSSYEGIVSPAYYVYNFTDNSYNKKYFHYLIRSCYKDEFRRLSGGIREGQWDLPSTALDNVTVLCPPIEEQNKIAEYLDKKTSVIEKTISEKQSQLEILAEYKKSIIYEYVTGKKEVI